MNKKMQKLNSDQLICCKKAVTKKAKSRKTAVNIVMILQAKKVRFFAFAGGMYAMNIR